MLIWFDLETRFDLLEENSSSKDDSWGNQGISDIQDSSKKEFISNIQFRYRKQISSSKQDISHKSVSPRKPDPSSIQDISINIKNIDPDCLMERFAEL